MEKFVRIQYFVIYQNLFWWQISRKVKEGSRNNGKFCGPMRLVKQNLKEMTFSTVKWVCMKFSEKNLKDPVMMTTDIKSAKRQSGLVPLRFLPTSI